MVDPTPPTNEISSSNTKEEYRLIGVLNESKFLLNDTEKNYEGYSLIVTLKIVNKCMKVYLSAIKLKKPCFNN